MIELCQRGREVDRSSRFADTALLISDGYGSSHLLRCRERTVTQIEKVALLDNVNLRHQMFHVKRQRIVWLAAVK